MAVRFDFIKDEIRKTGGYQSIAEGVAQGSYPIGVYGISDSARAALISAFHSEHDQSVYVVSHSDLEARQLYEDLLLYDLEVYHLPVRDPVFYNPYAISGDLRWERIKVLKEMTDGRKKIIVTSAEALTLAYMPLEQYKAYTFQFKKGDTIELKTLVNKLIDSGYESVELVEMRGQFAKRGGIIDIFSPVLAFPVRIELFGDEIDSIRTFNPESQRSIEFLDEVEIFPSKEIIISKAALVRGEQGIREEFEGILSNKAHRKALGEEGFARLKEVVANNLESLRNTWSFETIDSYLPFFYEKTESFFDYIGDGFIFLDDTGKTVGKMESVATEFSAQYEMFLKRGEILPSQGRLILPGDAVLAALNGARVITLNDLMKTETKLPPRQLAKFEEVTVYNFHGQLGMLIEDVREKKRSGYRTLILTGTRPRGERLEETLKENGVEAIYRDNPGIIPENGVVITFGSQKRGFDFKEIKLAVISDSEVFGEAAKPVRRKKTKGRGIEKLRSFDELKVGDYVVHVNHGIGVFKGIRQMETNKAVKDYLEVAYTGNDRLFVPVDQLDMIQKYIGNESVAPKVSKLGGSEWVKAKKKVAQNVDKVAKEIVELYAKRSKIKGFEFSRDNTWQREFEDEFEYEETPDQLTTTSEIKRDMESPRVMDRLLCGDVGYGKTEVAMRAAFKAVLDSKQVAVLVPTTILAEQHYKNFKRRFEGFAVNVDMISRFRTPKRVKETLDSLRNGTLDIIIGTHKLLGKGVVFHDLGLLIIDEEQRFGVTHKEKLKELKTAVDVLTLSATPIPRTLNMSMTGIRDISLIETPPEDRFPIQTYVTEYNDQLIRDAILREKSRNGQTFFVYNRVESIERMAAHLKQLVPEAEFKVAHGQLSERELERVMLSFMDGEFDVLVCSTIIETGLDIQNVNTLIVHDSDKFGLSQLYQLRGRVGRTNRIAYAYLTYNKDKVLTEVAEKRLKALKDFTELGAGFKIAMRDLEIRGAGNMMGKAQHGQMAEVGYDLYIRMLDEAVRKLTGTDEGFHQDTLVDIKVDAYIPYEYIKDEVIKIQMYKKIAAIDDRDDYLAVKGEMEDRFSDIPDVVYNLMDIALLKAKAKKAGVQELRERPSDILITFVDRAAITDGYIGVLSTRYPNTSQLLNSELPQIVFRYKGSKEQLIKSLSNLFDAFLHTMEIDGNQQNQEGKAEIQKPNQDSNLDSNKDSNKDSNQDSNQDSSQN